MGKEIEIRNGYAIVDSLWENDEKCVKLLPEKNIDDYRKNFKAYEEVIFLRNFNDETVGKPIHAGIVKDGYSTFEEKLNGKEYLRKYYIVVNGTKK